LVSAAAGGDFVFGLCQQDFRAPAEIGDMAVERAVARIEAAGLPRITVSERRSQLWLPDLVRTQHLDH
jgi:hypothetical protein